ncbi:MAG: hypothetical protein E7275_01810 [Pseudobutyrivibrio sp.]|uniref:Uncharacterized protein n=2 Tax=Pseudobutyrivibrio TaxID=46205 RepID=A0A2G3EBB6_9FIRM|nr:MULTISPECIES: hypothetical protein [Pseudobutyrivibrio]MBE5902997.1 hypothetical protein [Pseudobutyrivibrio sp.]NEX02862.1 hypothetical protein [Pseudobutyrivibrio xylanivorans]PHU40445.1 hypothetical protein CSX00_06030 [Pseudobutyrivibrio ruminis]SFR85945.1 hypothetical protein SAMN04487829_2680 [Pseudobutyrivibrio sp. NOR37]
MSQEKVDKKKFEKTHRRSLLRKKKLEEFLSIACVCVIAVGIVAWIGFSVYTKVENSKEANTTSQFYEIDSSALQEYLGSLQE